MIKSLKPKSKIDYSAPHNRQMLFRIRLLKFYKQDNPNYVSQSLENNMFGNNYEIIKVDTIKNIMNELNHNNIDLLKLDIEGSECDVLDKMLDDNILPKYLCIEFDLLLKNKDFNKKTEKIGKRMVLGENIQWKPEQYFSRIGGNYG